MASLQRKKKAPVKRAAFSMRDVIENLPAAQFFWHKKVPKRNQDKYWHLLGELITLFVSEQELSLYPHVECSYLFKYVCVMALQDTKFIETMLDILALNKDMVDLKLPTSLELTLHRDAAFVDLGTQTLESYLAPWLSDPVSKPILLLPFTTENPDVASSHAVLLALIKAEENKLYYIYLDPHGTTEENELFRNNLLNRIYYELFSELGRPYMLTELLETCPELQSPVQGGNCVQWVAMVICFLCMNPAYFHNPRPLVDKLGEHPELNILLFSLFFFIKTMPVFKLKQYYYSMFGLKPGERENYLRESREFNTFLHDELMEPNCKLFDSFLLNQWAAGCPAPCVACGFQCYESALVRKYEQFGGCSVLQPDEIAERMFAIYVDIQKLAGVRIPVNEQKEMKQQIVDLEVPIVLKDYIRLGLLTAEQVEEIERNERKRKREV
jgi:hypothetical protein